MTDKPVQSGRKSARRWLRWGIALALLAGTGIVITIGATPRPVGPAQGTAIAGADPKYLRVATFNIHSGVGGDGRLDLDRTARTLRGCNLIALNEVRGLAPWRSQSQDQTLAQRLALVSLFAPTERQWGYDAFGNAILTGHAITSWKRVPLEHSSGRGYRNVLLADVEFLDRTVHVMITHIDRGADREKQLRQLSDVFLKSELPAIFMGDFNTPPGDPLITTLLSTPGVDDPVGQKLGSNPSDRIDWIFSRGLKLVNAGMINDGASDHPMVWAEFER